MDGMASIRSIDLTMLESLGFYRGRDTHALSLLLSPSWSWASMGLKSIAQAVDAPSNVKAPAYFGCFDAVLQCASMKARRCLRE